MRVASSEIEDDAEEEEEREYSRDDALDEMQSAIPATAIELGTLEDEAENFTTWEIKDHFMSFRGSWMNTTGRYSGSHGTIIGDAMTGTPAHVFPVLKITGKLQERC